MGLGMTMVALSTVMLTAVAQAGTPLHPQVWQRWEQELTSSQEYANPYADVTLQVAYTGPEGRVLRTFGFWDGGDTFRLRCSYPLAGTWHWETTCSDTANKGLHGQHGTVTVLPYSGSNKLYRHGFLRVSDDRRFLVHADGRPFLWIGDTVWGAPMRATDDEWETYLQDRVAKHFTLAQVAPASRWVGTTDRRGEKPFTDERCSCWNPAYWQSFERKIHRANEQGLVVLLVGLMEPVSRYPEPAEACLFARNIVARLFGNLVLFSPSFDSPYLPLADQVGRATREATSVHLLTQHPGTPSGQPTPIFSDRYYDQPYLDIAGVQTGHNGGNLERCARQALDWNLHLYRHEPHKPVINLEAMYDAQGQRGWRAVDARSLGWRSWLSGAMGYTYGAGDVPPKCPEGSGALWRWVTDPTKYDYWEKALQWESSFQMQYLHDFLSRLEWWRLEPAPELLRNQPKEVMRRVALAKTAAGDLAVAYLPDNEVVEVDLSSLRVPLTVQWFDPVRGTYTRSAEDVDGKGTHRFEPPAKGDWVLLLQHVER